MNTQQAKTVLEAGTALCALVPDDEHVEIGLTGHAICMTFGTETVSILTDGSYVFRNHEGDVTLATKDLGMAAEMLGLEPPEEMITHACITGSIRGFVLRRRVEDEHYWIHEFRPNRPEVFFSGEEFDTLREANTRFRNKVDLALRGD